MIETLTELFRHAVNKNKSDLLNYKRDGKWVAVSSQELEEKVRTIAMGLYALGVRAGDRVGLLSENRIEWTLTDLGIINCGAADVPIYSTQAPSQVSYILNDAGCEVLFISNQAQYDRVRDALNECKKLRTIITFDPFEGHRGKIMNWDEFLKWGQAADASEPDLFKTLTANTTPETLATLIYTSGTTGEPKGVMLSHNNLASNSIAGSIVSGLSDREITLSYLPWAHVYERTGIYMFLYSGASTYIATSIDTLSEDLKEVRPHFMTNVPRMFEKIYSRATEKAEQAGPTKAKIAKWSVSIGSQWARLVANNKKPGLILSLKHAIADKLVFSKWRAAMGGRVKNLISGGAPLSPDLAYIFYGAGIRICQGYGLTETSPIIACNRREENKIGSVGRPFPGIEVKIAEDGEVLCCGPNVMLGYYGKEEETNETLETDSTGRIWLRTGDIGHLDEEGFLFITDRKKELLKTSGGKYIAPQPIENSIKQSRYVNQILILGDQRKFPAALIVPNFDAIKSYASQNGIDSGDTTSLINNYAITKLLESEVDRYTQNLAQYEKIKAVLLIEKEFSIEGGELTPKLSIKRRVVIDKYKELIDKLYSDKEASYSIAT